MSQQKKYLIVILIGIYVSLASTAYIWLWFSGNTIVRSSLVPLRSFLSAVSGDKAQKSQSAYLQTASGIVQSHDPTTLTIASNTPKSAFSWLYSLPYISRPKPTSQTYLLRDTTTLSVEMSISAIANKSYTLVPPQKYDVAYLKPGTNVTLALSLAQNNLVSHITVNAPPNQVSGSVKDVETDYVTVLSNTAKKGKQERYILTVSPNTEILHTKKSPQTQTIGDNKLLSSGLPVTVYTKEPVVPDTTLTALLVQL